MKDVLTCDWKFNDLNAFDSYLIAVRECLKHEQTFTATAFDLEITGRVVSANWSRTDKTISVVLNNASKRTLDPLT